MDIYDYDMIFYLYNDTCHHKIYFDMAGYLGRLNLAIKCGSLFHVQNLSGFDIGRSLANVVFSRIALSIYIYMQIYASDCFHIYIYIYRLPQCELEAAVACIAHACYRHVRHATADTRDAEERFSRFCLSQHGQR
jgi:hypothetical protein